MTTSWPPLLQPRRFSLFTVLLQFALSFEKRERVCVLGVRLTTTRGPGPFPTALATLGSARRCGVGRGRDHSTRYADTAYRAPDQGASVTSTVVRKNASVVAMRFGLYQIKSRFKRTKCRNTAPHRYRYSSGPQRSGSASLKLFPFPTWHTWRRRRERRRRERGRAARASSQRATEA